MRTYPRLLGPVLALSLGASVSLIATAANGNDGRPHPLPPPTSRSIHTASFGASTGADRFAERGTLLAKPLRGSAALKALSASDQAIVAERNNMSTTHLRTMVSADPTVWVGRDGRVFYADTAAASATQAAVQSATQSGPAWTQHPLAESLHLHSDPGATRTIYLDFGGYTLPSGAWWATNGGIPAGSYGGFSLDSTVSNAYTDDELDYIQTVWRIVSEKYSAFDVDVTTEDPGPDAYNRTSQADTTYGTHVVITNDMNARGSACTADVSGGCIGIGLIGAFNAVEPLHYLEPAWVFTKFTAGSPVLAAGIVANDAAHEIGHTLALEHDRTSATAYYGGHDDWFPIMGSSDLAIGQFNNGGYPGAVTDQIDPLTGAPNPDDFDVIEKSGLSLRTDEYSHTTDLGSRASYTEDGVIARPDQTDVYSINRTCSGPLTVSASGIGLGQAVDLKLTVQNPIGSVVATDDPAATHLTPRTEPDTPSGMDASTDIASADPGTWLISVDGVGLDGPTGYSDYGSVGQYHLTVSGCAADTGAVVTAPQSPVVQLTDRSTTAIISWQPPCCTPFQSYLTTGATPTSAVGGTPVTTVSGLVPGVTNRFTVRAYNSTTGEGAPLVIHYTVKTWTPTDEPGMAIFAGTLSGKPAVAILGSEEPNPGMATPLEWRTYVYRGSTLVKTFDEAYTGPNTELDLTGVPNGVFTFKDQLLYASDLGGTSPSASRQFLVGATAPRIGTPSSGRKGGPATATVRWSPPAANDGSPLTGYKAIAYKLGTNGRIVASYVTSLLKPATRSFTGRLPKGRYKFRVIAYNRWGVTAPSGYSSVVTAR